MAALAGEEEWSLFYVALTHARRSVRLSWLQHRREREGGPSRFIGEAPSSLLEGTTGPILSRCLGFQALLPAPSISSMTCFNTASRSRSA